MAEQAVDVDLDLGDEVVAAGRLWLRRGRRGAESATFAYDPVFLARPDAYALDPGLPLVEGPIQTPAGRAAFGAFADCAPDRWGRRLVARDERHRAARDGDAERSFGEGDYLLRVRDDVRQGALRLRAPGSETYLAGASDGVPPLVDLPRLLGAAERLERHAETDDDLRVLLRGGSSLGGARPKADVLAADGRLAVAKFPSPATDDWDVIRWEYVTLGLARAAGISVPEAELLEVDGRPILTVGRFDRDGGRRIGFVSAMTMLEAADGAEHSYVEIAEAIEEHSPQAATDLRELWRRMVFGVLVSNTDDHLRNHGFLRTSTAGWTLAPAFDLNPDPRPGSKDHSTSIDGGDPAAGAQTALAVAPLFRLDQAAAREVLEEVERAVAGWPAAAEVAGLSPAEIDAMRPAFEHEDA